MKADSFFLPYQRAWIEDKSRIKIMEKSRQIGMSWTAAYSLVREHSISGKRLDSWVCSRDEMQARLFLFRLLKIRRYNRSCHSRLQRSRSSRRKRRKLHRFFQRNADMVALLKRGRTGGKEGHEGSRRICPPPRSRAAVLDSVSGDNLGRKNGDYLDPQGLGQFF